MQLHEFESEQKAKEHKVYKLISSNEAEQFFGLSGMLTKLEDNKTNPTMVTDIIPNMPTTIGNICKTVLNTLAKSGGKFDVDPNTATGQINQIAMGKLVAEGLFIQEQINAFVNLGVTMPYAAIKEGEYEAAVAAAAIVPVEVEALYPSETYIITTGNQGIDVEVATNKDCKVTIYLAVCNDTGNQHDIANYQRYEQAVGYINCKNGKGILSLSSRKVRQYNKLFAIADNDAVINATVKVNRG